jgi:hypothetical protein
MLNKTTQNHFFQILYLKILTGNAQILHLLLIKAKFFWNNFKMTLLIAKIMMIFLFLSKLLKLIQAKIHI